MQTARGTRTVEMLMIKKLIRYKEYLLKIITKVTKKCVVFPGRMDAGGVRVNVRSYSLDSGDLPANVTVFPTAPLGTPSTATPSESYALQ